MSVGVRWPIVIPLLPWNAFVSCAAVESEIKHVAIVSAFCSMLPCLQCQCCGHVGSWAVSVARVVSVLFGVTLSVLVCNTVLPWYTSTWCIQTMKGTFITAVELVNQMHAQFYADGAAAVAAFEAQAAACQHVSTDAPVSCTPAQSAQSGPAGHLAGKDYCAAFDSGAKASAAAAAEVAAAAGESSAMIACKGPATCPLVVTPAVLQSMIARPLVSVQTSLLMDTVAWQRGVLATPPVSSCAGTDHGHYTGQCRFESLACWGSL